MSEVGSHPFLSIRFQVVRLALFCGVTLRMEVSERGLGGVSVVVEFLEGISWYCVGMVLWVNVELAMFCGVTVMLEILERGLVGDYDVELFLDRVE